MCRTAGSVVVLLVLLSVRAECTFLEVAKIAGAVVKELVDLWQWAAEELAENGGPGLPFGGGDKLATRIRVLSDRVSLGEQKTRAAEHAVFHKLVSIPNRIRYELKINTLFDIVLGIDRVNDIYRDYLEIGLKNLNRTDRGPIEDDTLFDLLQVVVSHRPDSIRSSLDKHHQMIVVQEGRSFLNRMGLFKTFLRYFQIVLSSCGGDSEK